MITGFLNIYFLVRPTGPIHEVGMYASIFQIFFLIGFGSILGLELSPGDSNLLHKFAQIQTYCHFLRKKENTAIQVIAVTDEILKLLGEEEK